MTDKPTQTPAGDEWSEWLLQVRHGRSANFRPKVAGVVDTIRDRVLDAARLKADMTLLDVGTGDGLVALGAIQRVGPSLRVIMTDASQALLCHTTNTARERGVESQCTFVHGNAQRLHGIADASIDVVTIRAVLAYVADKPAALAEIFRVLRPGGRFSMADPILQDEAFAAAALTRMLQTQPRQPDFEFLRLVQRWKAAQYPSTEQAIAANPITNFSERDLVRMVDGAGFTSIHMELHIDAHESWITDWEVFLDVSPHPLAKPLRQIFNEEFSLDERLFFERVMRPQVESGHTVSSDVIAYLSADKPAKG
jgi:ubiquinone/menaquinone biosynthesis C-methylase UbiE